MIRGILFLVGNAIGAYVAFMSGNNGWGVAQVVLCMLCGAIVVVGACCGSWL